MHYATKAILLVSATFAATSAQAANLIINGDFEAPVVTGPCCITAPPTPIPGWTVNSGNVNVVSAGFIPAFGSQWLDLIGEAPTGSISQAFTTIAGKYYKLTFQYGNNPGIGTASANLSVGNISRSITSSTGPVYTTYTSLFKATGSSSTLNFTSTLGGNNAGIALDNISVTATPEPEAWASMALGLGLAGWVARRRRRQQGAAAVA